MHDWAEVHRLFHREGRTRIKIGGTLEMSRNKVARLLELSEPPQYERASQGSKLDPYKGVRVVLVRSGNGHGPRRADAHRS